MAASAVLFRYRPCVPQMGVEALSQGAGLLAHLHSANFGAAGLLFRLFFRFSRPPDMKSRKNQSIEQWAAGYDPQAAAMRTLPHGAHLSSTARGSSPEP